MEVQEILRQRLINQHIAGTRFTKPQEIVRWMVAMQAQEFAMAKWAIGLRLPSATEKEIETLFNKGKILRTHLLRPTWHFVVPDDIRWLITLTSPRVNAANAFMYRKLELDQKVFKRTNAIIEKLLTGGKHLTREVINGELERRKVIAKGLRLGYIFMRAELDGLICSGPRVGKQFTYALLDERVPAKKSIGREESLIELTTRYFTSRGPATIKDFVTWSGLTMKEAKQGISSLPSDFRKERIGAQDYFMTSPVRSTPTLSVAVKKQLSTFIMPDYDEYGMSYKDRSALRPTGKRALQKISESSEYTHWMIIDGVISGSWKKPESNDQVVEVSPFESLNRSQSQDVKKAIERYSFFVAGNDDAL